MQRAGRFVPAADILRPVIREVGEARGFLATRLLTHWPEIVGEEIARLARPLEVRHPRPSRKGAPDGATLVVLALGAAALRLEMERDRICDRVNACYGYKAVARLRIRQTSAAAFAAGSAPPAPPVPPAAPGPAAPAETCGAEGINDTRLRLALAALAANVLSRSAPDGAQDGEPAT